ncbi:MAG: DinB family protein [Acidobacteriia bacterium]|nr:DinB family protein [Terriglobia bacterium]
MNKLAFMVLGATMTVCASAQTAPQADENPMSSWLRTTYKGNHNNIVRTAEKMPEEFYEMRPGAQQEVRTFGQQVGHVANYNFLWCSQAKGEKNPNTQNLEKLTTKAEFLKAASDAFAYCDAVYDSLTDASGTQMVDITLENGQQRRNLRLGLLTLNFAHNNEIYGSMVIYLRMKNIVPPASEPRPQQKK